MAQQSKKEKILVCSAWPYANGDLHLGHVAGAYLPADIFARFHRLLGNDVLFVSGSDAHGTPITLKAKQEGVTPLEIVNRYHERFLEGWSRLGITFDHFTHTHTENHIKVVSEIFQKLKEQGDLKVATQQQFFDVQEKMFLPDRYVHGTCPFCDSDKARGDQCESCGKTYETSLLKNPVSTLSDSTPELRDTDHFFFHMEHYQEALAKYVATQDHWRPAVKNFTASMIDDGLRSRAITRDIDWGIPVPEAGWEEKVIYVWFDAVIGYLSASKEWAALSGIEDAWQDWWKDKDAKTYYFIGKDNVPFHTVIWPIELMAYDPELNLPFDVPANQFLNIAGEKFSTSRGLAVWLLDVLDKFDADSVRFYLTSIMPETKDANFSWDEFFTRNNGELVAAWGNLVNRVFGFAHKRYDAIIPQPQELAELDTTLLSEIEAGFETVAVHYKKVELRDALKEAMRLVRCVNRYLDEKAPWTAFKTDPVAAGTSVYVAMKAIDSLKILLAPVLPNSSEEIHRAFGYSTPLFESQWAASTLEAGKPFSRPEPLYKVLEAEEETEE
ncbi:UNVERIFIED_CONTAM: hypothetical protein GTU68_045607 [Idotea baltica]|nr:hypothetical protein [Idotea baltica]